MIDVSSWLLIVGLFFSIWNLTECFLYVFKLYKLPIGNLYPSSDPQLSGNEVTLTVVGAALQQQSIFIELTEFSHADEIVIHSRNLPLPGLPSGAWEIGWGIKKKRNRYNDTMRYLLPLYNISISYQNIVPKWNQPEGEKGNLCHPGRTVRVFNSEPSKHLKSKVFKHRRYRNKFNTCDINHIATQNIAISYREGGGEAPSNQPAVRRLGSKSCRPVAMSASWIISSAGTTELWIN